ncbi:MAG: 3-phosphoshikimate 1-carboxyvinyltransferase [Chitinophagales bacterium]|jgi:3-phosphoshikimate 1-carboxyvinyltransferase|nr:hypothetical protein [Sphingobacteriales bacterium]
MDVVIESCQKLAGVLSVPPSKSYSQRALAASFLIPTLEILNLGKSTDELSVLDIIKSTEAELVWREETHLVVHSSFDFTKDVTIHCHESGLCARLFLGLMLLNKGKTLVEGTGSLLHRPMNSLYPVFDQLGLAYQGQQNHLPITYHGNRRAIDLEIDGSISSQFISGLLYYLVGLNHQQVLRLGIKNLKSKPYLDMTIDLLRGLGASIDWIDGGLQISPSILKSKASILVEGDWSSAAFWIVAAAISGDIALQGLNPNSLQADLKILDIVKEFGAKLNWEKGSLSIQSNRHRPFTADLRDAPDLAPILAVLAIFAEGESKLMGVNRLIHKESNRLSGILNWLESLQIHYSLEENNLMIFGKSKLNLAVERVNDIEFESNGDHRMAMAASVLALFLMGGKLKGCETVQKSYPDFYPDLEKLGGLYVLK